MVSAAKIRQHEPVLALPNFEDLQLLEIQVSHALAKRDLSELNVIGFGEISIALGWPYERPQFVCKRTPPGSQAQLATYARLIDNYIEKLAAQGIACIETTTVSVERDDGVSVGYLVQPLQTKEILGDNVLRDAQPSADHPMLQALCEVLNKITPRLSVDSQFSNWTWDGHDLRLLDVGSPFVWDEQRRFELEISPFMVMMPWPIRRLVHRDMLSLTSRWQKPRGAAVDVAASLFRLELEHWMDAVLQAFNSKVVPGQPITATEARAIYDEDLKTWPRLRQMQQIQRAWQTRVRRQQYEFFIQNSYTGEII